MEENLIFTVDKINAIINEEKERKESIEKKYSSIEEFNKAEKKDNEEIVKDGRKYKLISDGFVSESFDTKNDVDNFLKKESLQAIRLLNYFLSEMSNDYFIARISLMYHNLQNASEEVCDEVGRLSEINDKVTQKKEVICVGNHMYFNMGENYVSMNIHDFSKSVVEEIDYNDFVITN